MSKEEFAARNAAAELKLEQDALAAEDATPPPLETDGAVNHEPTNEQPASPSNQLRAGPSQKRPRSRSPQPEDPFWRPSFSVDWFQPLPFADRSDAERWFDEFPVVRAFPASPSQLALTPLGPLPSHLAKRNFYLIQNHHARRSTGTSASSSMARPSRGRSRRASPTSRPRVNSPSKLTRTQSTTRCLRAAESGQRPCGTWGATGSACEKSSRKSGVRADADRRRSCRRRTSSREGQGKQRNEPRQTRTAPRRMRRTPRARCPTTGVRRTSSVRVRSLVQFKNRTAYQLGLLFY